MIQFIKTNRYLESITSQTLVLCLAKIVPDTWLLLLLGYTTSQNFTRNFQK